MRYCYDVYTDEQLIALLKESDEAAFSEIYDRYRQRLYRSASRKLAAPEQAEEIVQDVFLDIWKRREQLEIRHLPAYLEQAVRFRLINFVTRQKIPAFFDLFDTVLFSPYEADQLLKQKDLVNLIKAWIDVLPKNQRHIFIQHYLQELSVKEIAHAMALSPKTVQNNLSLSLQYLRTRLSSLTTILLAMGICLTGVKLP
ncbi:RNA polymerase sigma factor [Chitinophaga qingshengii]|uniref:Sigma-70 family RNA polymerase sigma factor n=1 Tax=Chitinophaga qingshengii TaxID=1569794 RepID=A0ABR7TRA5_9BACT|nr:sigma-70 family RNA polymerase sigma factor [Chitinophaga qingshengii]MBC9933022.1 sigma-70 family RNA polymerase sigma factor [Chitinophaga qingshengii]